jgi:hypothetical protein
VATNPNNRPKPKTILTLLKEIKLAERREQQILHRQRQLQLQQSEISEEDGDGSEGGGSSSGGPITPLGSARRGSELLVISRSDSGAFTSSPLLSARSNGSGGGRERTGSEYNVRRNTGGESGKDGSGIGRSGSGIGQSGSGISENTDNDEEVEGYTREDDAMRRQRLSSERKKRDSGIGFSNGNSGGSSPSARRKNSANVEEQLMYDVFGDKHQRRSRRNTKIFAVEEEALGSIFASNLGRGLSDDHARPRSQTNEKLRDENPRKRRDTSDPDKCLLM